MTTYNLKGFKSTFRHELKTVLFRWSFDND